MKVLIACEFSGIVRDAFAAKGHDAWSCDLLPSEKPGQHYQGDVKKQLYDVDFIYRYPNWQGWDMIIAFPPCTDLAVSGARWFPEKVKNGSQKKSVELFMMIINAPVDKMAIENPIGIMSTQYRKPDQIVQPWQFGHGETKATCLWLKGLPKLVPTNIVEGREGKVWKMAPGPNRAKDRSRTYSGIAQAMANQWG